MSEQARVTYLQERIKNAKSGARAGWIFLFFGLFVIAFQGVGIYYSNTLGETYIIGIILGVICIAGGLFLNLYSEHKNIRLMQELERMSFPNLNCSKCGKELPKGNYAFCPFCASPVVPPPP